MLCYVILHYQSLDVTKKCVETLLRSSQGSDLVIVDNCSPNGSGKVLKALYATEKRVTVILSNENLGFARGNNLGYKYAKIKFKPEFMVVMNNDVMIDDRDFENTISDYMVNHKVDVAGSDIVTLKNNHQNPLATTVLSSKHIKKRIRIDKLKCLFFKIDPIFKFYISYKKNHLVPIKEKQDDMMNCILHGSCVIYSSRYIQAEEFAFLPITYMYNEEAILYDYLQYKGYKTGYCSETTVLHMEGAATTECMRDNKEKIIFRFKNNTASLQKQLKERGKYSRR